MSNLTEKLGEYLKNPPLSEADLDREIILFADYDNWSPAIMKALGEKRSKVVGVCKIEPKEPATYIGKNWYFRVNTVSPEFVIQNARDSILLVTVWNKELNDRIKEQFRGLGLPFVTDIFGYTFSQACAGCILPQTELMYLSEAYDFFESESEKQIVFEKALYVIGAIKETPFVTPQYFVSGMKFSEDEIIADCGFYTGDTAEDYIKYAGGFKKYYGFEPSGDNLAKVKLGIAADPRIEIVEAGVHSYNTVLHFSDTGEDSSFGDFGGESLPVVSLDSFFEGKEPPTFIKMDIEGSEIAALLGAKYIIKEYKPKLAICLYHKPEDIIEIPKLIKQLNPDYKTEVFCHTNIGADIVIYCY
jgi:FkbM family methyltransferase